MSPDARPEVLPPRPTALAPLDPQALITRAVEHGAGIEVLERLVALAKDVRAMQAKEAWHRAMAEFQRTCPPIIKTGRARIATRGGGAFTYRYATLDEILRTVQPIMGPLGLSLSWIGGVTAANQVSQSCRISHELGHAEDSGFVSIPVGSVDEGRGVSSAQRVGIALTYAKRYALLAILGLAPEDDPDANDEGALPTRETRAEPPSPDESPLAAERRDLVATLEEWWERRHVGQGARQNWIRAHLGADVTLDTVDPTVLADVMRTQGITRARVPQ
jgi:ERF superfamily